LAITTTPTLVLVASATATAAVKAIAEYVCDGSDDGATINTAITACEAAGGGLVQLTEGSFSIDTVPVRLRRKVTVAGSQWAATTLQGGSGTWTAHDGTTPGAIVEPHDNTQDRVGLRDVVIAGGAGTLKGIYARITSNTGFVYGDDSRWILERVFIRGVKSHGIDIGGTYCREWSVRDLHVFDIGSGGTANGAVLGGSDSVFDMLRCGACTGTGIVVSGSNHSLDSCKAFFNDLLGAQVTGVRNTFNQLHVQDNLQHGVSIEGIANGFTGLVADSNSYDGSPSGAITGRTFSGVRVNAGLTVISGAQAFDKNEGSRGLRQVNGYLVEATVSKCNIQGLAWDNFTNAVNMVATEGADNRIVVVGRDSGGTGLTFLRPSGW
jgi:hypothetical protein